MKLITKNGEKVLQADRYQLIFPTERPFVYLETPTGERITELFIFSSLHPMNGRDETYEISEWSIQETKDGFEASVRAKSTAWQTKTCTFCCFPERLTYFLEVEGNSQLAEVVYFGGYYSGSNKRWGSGFFWSGQNFTQLFNPEPNIPEVFHSTPNGTSKIDLMGVPIPAKGDWFFTPPPFCFAGQYETGWLAMGVEAKAGQNQYTEYLYHGSLNAFYLSLSYEGHTEIQGRFKTPYIGFDFATGEYEALAAHTRALQATGYVPSPKPKVLPEWWRTPIFCGWGSECYLASIGGGRAPDYARQEYYYGFLSALAQNNLQPGIVVLDDKWQAAYGKNVVNKEKWPDLRRFIDEQHAVGRRVLLWLKAWDPEGVPTEECITNPAGIPMAVDPTNPAFEQRFRTSIRHMLSEEGYNADGFKVDFSARIPSGPGMKIYGKVWGLELMKNWLSILYTEAKQTKPDALVMTHTPHPYLADVLDMIRLNDINIGQDVNRAMKHRARVASIACPDAIIDTDNWPITDKAAWRAYLPLQVELGIPSLYYATHIDFTGEALDDEDYQLIRDVWAEYRSKQT